MKALFILIAIATTTTYAGNCAIDITREACPGKETESYAKCDNKKQCVEKLEAKTEKECMKKALEKCDNARLDITKSKIITASFDGKPIQNNKNFCDADRPDFNKCKK